MNKNEAFRGMEGLTIVEVPEFFNSCECGSNLFRDMKFHDLRSSRVLFHMCELYKQISNQYCHRCCTKTLLTLQNSLPQTPLVTHANSYLCPRDPCNSLEYGGGSCPSSSRTGVPTPVPSPSNSSIMGATAEPFFSAPSS